MIRWPSAGSSPVVSVSRTILLNLPPFFLSGTERRDALVRERIRALVAIMTRMPLHPDPLDLVRDDELVEPLPEVHVLPGFLRRRAPAARPPVADPLRI